MDSDILSIKKVFCLRHSKEVITHVCTFPDCQYQSILICSKCQSTESSHLTHHKKSIINAKEFLDDQMFIMDPSFTEELILRLRDLERKSKNIEDEFKSEESDIDKDFSALFAVFFQISEMSRNSIKALLRENYNKVIEKKNNLIKVLETAKANKTEAKEVMQLVDEMNADNAEEIYKGLLSKRQSKYQDFNLSVANLISDYDASIKNKTVYKKTDTSKKTFEEIKETFEKSCSNILSQFKLLLEDPSKKLKAPESSTKLNFHTPIRDKHLDQSVARIAQDIERSKNIIKNSNKQSVDLSSTPMSAKKLPSFPEITNAKVAEALKHFQEIRYPENLEIEGLNTQTPITSYPVHEFPDVSIYQGQIKNGKKQGVGRIIFLDGGLYEGTWNEDVPSGYGRLIRRNGDVYEGFIKEFHANGIGLFATLDGYLYRGEWVYDKKEGNGEESRQGSKFMYKGQFKNNKYHGHGVAQLENGKIYEGEFIEGRFTGHGTCKTIISETQYEYYEGDFVDWKMHGKGKLITFDGSIYEGHFSNDLPDGFGEFKWPDGSLFRGTWKGGIQHGIGEEIDAHGIRKEGEWQDGKWIHWIK